MESRDLGKINKNLGKTPKFIINIPLRNDLELALKKRIGTRQTFCKAMKTISLKSPLLVL